MNSKRRRCYSQPKKISSPTLKCSRLFLNMGILKKISGLGGEYQLLVRSKLLIENFYIWKEFNMNLKYAQSNEEKANVKRDY